MSALRNIDESFLSLVISLLGTSLKEIESDQDQEDSRFF
jgi:hypothetical protein